MADKQIIIDGVDVSGCEYFKINRGFNCYKGHNCTDKECHNCYYKQLKRKEQECERLTSTLTEIKAFVQKEIEYFEHDIEYQYDWKELMKLIKTNEVEDE